MNPTLSSLIYRQNFTWNTDVFPYYADLDLGQICQVHRLVCSAAVSSEPINKPTAEPIAKPITATIAEPISEPVTATITKPISEPVTATITEPITEPVVCRFYGSTDGVSYFRLPLEHPLTSPTAPPLSVELSRNVDCRLRYLRLHLVHCLSAPELALSQIQIFGACLDETDTDTKEPTPLKTFKAVKPSAALDPSESLQNSESVRPSAALDPSESLQNSESVRPSAALDPSESLQNSESVRPSAAPDPSESPRVSESFRSSAIFDPSDLFEPFEETVYAKPITAQETEAYLYGLVERTVGAEYRDWFTFRLTRQEGNEQFCIRAAMPPETGMVCIEANTGVALAVGLNYYYKHFCNVHISQEERQTAMPKHAPIPKERILRTAADPIRYAYNYCTHSYTMPFWDEEQWQKELDWLALCGVNLILDITGIEAVWYLFLKESGYTDREIQNWIVGPCYTAWQAMQNMEGFGGPLHPAFIRDRVTLARRNQRLMRILGMQPILQHYAGMVPSRHASHDPEAALCQQGSWNGITRPAMLDPSSPEYQRCAQRFYAIQQRIFGQSSHYYAIDPFHEGGMRPQNLTDDKIAALLMNQLLSWDPQAVWVIQAWRDNPTRQFLSGISEEQRSHLLILDLSATDNPGSIRDEFAASPWVYCMLDIYGGRVSTHGETDVLAQIPAVRKKSRMMRGIGFSSEATYHNPVVYELLFETAWEETPICLDTWIDAYIRRRYGTVTPEIRRGWELLLKTAYRDPGFSHHGGYTQIFTYRPRMDMRHGSVWNELNSSIIKSPYYDPKEFFSAVQLFCESYETYRGSACYIRDLQDLLRQTCNLLGTELAFELLEAYHLRDLPRFDQAAQRFLQLMDACDRLMQIRKDTLLGSWLGQAESWGSRYDDFSKDLFLLNAKALITTWGYQKTYPLLADYAYRQYGELFQLFYQKRWQLWIRHLRQALSLGQEAEDLSVDFWFQRDWSFVIDETAVCRRTPLDPDPILKEVMNMVL